MFETNTRQLTVDFKEKMFIGEISATNGIGRLYDDACDIGLTLISSRTGKATRWCLDESKTTYDAEGVLISLKLFPSYTDVKKNPALKGWTLVLYND